MQVKVFLFALFREQAGTSRLELSLPENATVGTAKEKLEAQFSFSLSGGLAAVNQDFVQVDYVLKEGDELAFLPPVSGGVAETQTMDSFGITYEALDVGHWNDWASGEPYGAVCTFLGTTRSPNKNQPVAYLEYEAYPGMAERVMGQMIGEMRERWVLGKVAIWHRLGRVNPKEASILIVVSSPHRPEAFEACRYAIERVKQILPVWKKEYRPDGSFWVEGHAGEEFKL